MRLSRRIPGHYPQTLRGVIHTTGSTSLIATPPEDRATTRGHAQNFGEIGRVVRRYTRGQTRHTDTITKILRSLTISVRKWPHCQYVNDRLSSRLSWRVTQKLLTCNSTRNSHKDLQLQSNTQENWTH